MRVPLRAQPSCHVHSVRGDPAWMQPGSRVRTPTPAVFELWQVCLRRRCAQVGVSMRALGSCGSAAVAEGAARPRVPSLTFFEACAQLYHMHGRRTRAVSAA